MGKLKLLIDADILIHKAGHSNIGLTSASFDGPDDVPYEDLPSAKLKFISLVDEVRYACAFDPESETETFLAVTIGKSRRSKVLSEYKGNRPKHPEIINKLKSWIIEEMSGVGAEGSEADDILGMHQKLDGSTIICTEDKDLLQIPGDHYNWRSKEFFSITPELGLRNFYKQVLVGDSCDNYKGCPGIGIKKAEALLRSIPEGSLKNAWSIIEDTFVAQGSTKEEALKMARVAYILHPEDSYDYSWEPPKKTEENPKNE